MIHDVIYSLVVLIEKFKFFNKQLSELCCILNQNRHKLKKVGKANHYFDFFNVAIEEKWR